MYGEISWKVDNKEEYREFKDIESSQAWGMENYKEWSENYKKVMKKYSKLCKNNLYTTDLHSSNVLLTKDKLDVEIIDIDRNGIEISSSFNKDLYNYVTYEYNKLILEILFEEYNPILSTSSKRTSEILELYKIKNYYIDYIINRKTTFKFSKEFLEYIEKDKIILKN